LRFFGVVRSYANHTLILFSTSGSIVAGSTQSFGAGGFDFWILKLDSSGNIQWQKTYGGSIIDIARSIQTTSDDGYIVAGETTSFGAGNRDFWILKMDSSGNIQWQKTHGGTNNDSTTLHYMCLLPE
jgi:predicted secreted protein